MPYMFSKSMTGFSGCWLLEGTLAGDAILGRAMDKTIRRFSSFDEMKADEYRYWQSVSGRERMQAVSEITLEAYALKGRAADVQRLQRTLIRIQRP